MAFRHSMAGLGCSHAVKPVYGCPTESLVRCLATRASPAEAKRKAEAEATAKAEPARFELVQLLHYY